MKYKFIWLIAGFALYVLPCFAQEVVFDPSYFESVTANGMVLSAAESTHDRYLGQINNNLDDINLNVSSVVLAQKIIYNGLADVNAALKNGAEVKNMAVTINDMIGYLDQCLQLAKTQPYLLLFAQNIEKELQARSVALVSDVSGFILKEGDNMLADYNARDHLLSKVTQQLEVMDGLAYGAWRAMYWAMERGLIASLNPYQAYINRDKIFVSQIIANTKYLRKTNP